MDEVLKKKKKKKNDNQDVFQMLLLLSMKYCLILTRHEFKKCEEKCVEKVSGMRVLYLYMIECECKQLGETRDHLPKLEKKK